MTRDYKHFDGHLNKLIGQIYPQPEDDGHTALAKQVIDAWMSKMTTCHSVLDVGCGTGFCQTMFERWDVKYEGICLGQDYIEATNLGRNVKKMDFTFLDYPDDSFDLIFSRHSLEHSPFPLISLMEWARVAKNWLGIVLPTPEWYTYRGHNHYSVMNMEQIKNLLDVAGWKLMWEDIRFLTWNEDKGESRPHEYWLMSEKKR